jgi:CBS domain-containing protein
MNTVKKIIKRRGGQVWSIKPDDTAMDALRMMVEKDIGAVLVMEDEKICGIISERDIARKITYEQRIAEGTPANEIMSSAVITIDADQTVETARAMMTSHRIRHLPVIEKGNVIGVLSTRDVVSEFIVIQRQTIDFYKDIALDE